MNRPPMQQLFVVDTLIGPGLHILAGSPKVGKSWLALWLTVNIAKGEPVWGMEVKQGDTLYLCLEDNESRIQNRLFHITDYAPPNCHFCVSACTLGKGLEEQIDNFVLDHPQTTLIIVDTIQMVRNTTWDNTYSSDYKDLTALKELADRFGIAILLIHHLRKEEAGDVFNRISGTTGMQGAVDSSFTLVEEKRGSGRATLSCIGRDIEFRVLELEKTKEQVWELVEDSLGENGKPRDRIVPLIELLMAEKKEIKLTPSELAEQLNSLPENSGYNYSNRIVSRRLQECYHELSSLGIQSKSYSSNGKRLIKLWCNGDDGGDIKIPHPDTQNTATIVPAK